MQFHRRYIILVLVLCGAWFTAAASEGSMRDISNGLPKRHMSLTEASKDGDTPVCPCTVFSIEGGG